MKAEQRVAAKTLGEPGRECCRRHGKRAFRGGQAPIRTITPPCPSSFLMS